jgi:hypothetical protein
MQTVFFCSYVFNLLVPQFVSITWTGFETGLFSATVGAFIIEFYKKLSPDSGNQTVALLGQISQQLANSPNSSYSNTANQSSLSASMVWVNAMWLISLVLSLTSALIATLLQQWARRYIETPKVQSQPKDRARVRSFLFQGTELYKMRLLVELAPTLLHLSVYLFFGGLVIAFHTIHKKVAIAVDAAVGLFALAYTVLTVLPFLDIRCPYRTPMTYILWYSVHTFLSFLTHAFYWFLEWLHGCLVSPDSDGSMSSGQLMLVNWLTSCENIAKKHWRYVTDGLGRSIIDGAKSLEDGDRKIIAWLFSQFALYDKNKLLVFAASIPRHKVVDFIPPIKSGKIVLRKPLLALLRSCSTDDTGAGDPGENVRKAALSVCLTAIHDIAKVSIIPDLNFVRGEFANISLMRLLWNDSDDYIRITSRSICALIARQVVRKRHIEDADLSWLEEVTGEPSGAILEADVTVLDLMNFKSFIYGALPNNLNADDWHPSTETATSLKETLVILLDERTDNRFSFTPDRQARLSEEVGRIQQYDPEGGREAFNRLQSVFPSPSAAPSVNMGPSTYPESPSISSFHEAPFVHHEGPSFPVVSSRPAPHPPLVTPSP